MLFVVETPAELPPPPPLVCLDPGHSVHVPRGTEPIGPGSSIRKAKDTGGTAGEVVVVLQIASKARRIMLARGVRVAMTRTGPDFTYGERGNADRAKFCNRREAALMLRIHADGSTDPGRHGVSTLYPAWHRGWTDDVYGASLRAARLVQRALVFATGAADRGLSRRGDLTGFNWANVPVVLAETGFMTNAVERRRLTSSAYQWRVARGLTRGAMRFLGR
ncbi:MAG: N-acetylmuramoyl-L-alanine amidase [Actinobacteria bacterium]|nr:N-acetylmuramoyl-L-alanine amidase [Actinomycetota bacterium]